MLSLSNDKESTLTDDQIAMQIFEYFINKGITLCDDSDGIVCYDNYQKPLVNIYNDTINNKYNEIVEANPKPKSALGEFFGLYTIPSVYVYAQETEEEQTVIESAPITFVTCDYTKDQLSSYKQYSLQSLQLQQCDYDIKFLKGLCESTNNTGYDYCTDTKMDSYLIIRGQIDAPKPNDVWCDHFIDKCIDLIEGFKKEYGDMADIDVINDKLEKLKEKQ